MEKQKVIISEQLEQVLATEIAECTSLKRERSNERKNPQEETINQEIRTKEVMEYIFLAALLVIMFFAWRQFYLTHKKKNKHGRK